jgi:NAD(P)-dependent dehydrogenase (short-subunit alcohol dehydrogenase family)
MTSLIIGASGGIGLALAEALQARGPVLTLSRSAGEIDLTDQESIAAAAERSKGHAPFARIIIAAGLLLGDGAAPERSLRELDADRLARSFAVNAIGPALCARYFLPLLSPDGRFAALSARVGSISDNRLGGWYGYRAAKAALNQFIRTAAIELARTRPQAVCVTLHPGTVDTAMSRPFQRGVPAERLFSPQHSAECLLNVLDRLSPHDSGKCFDWAGEPVPF